MKPKVIIENRALRALERLYDGGGAVAVSAHDKATCPECQPYPEGRGGTVYPEYLIARDERRARWVEGRLGRRVMP